MIKTINEIAEELVYLTTDQITEILTKWSEGIIEKAAEVAQEVHDDNVSGIYDHVYDYCTQLIA